MRRAAALSSLAALAAACSAVTNADLSSGDLPIGLSLTTSVSPAEIAPGDTARITVTLRNTRPSPVTLHFGSGCQLLYVVETDTGEPVPQEGGGIGCVEIVTSLTVPAGGQAVRTFDYTGTGYHFPPYGKFLRADGNYRIFGTLEPHSRGGWGELGAAPTPRARSAPATLRLRNTREFGAVSDVAVGVRIDTTAADKVPVVIVRAQNLRNRPAAMRFSSTCQFTFVVVLGTLTTGGPSARGGESCAGDAVTTLDIAPGAAVERSFRLTRSFTDVETGEPVTLPAGVHAIYGALGSPQDYELRSPVAFVRVQ